MSGDTSFSPRRALALGFITLAALGAVLFGWGTMASISGAVIAFGRIETETRDHVVEHVDGGTVAEVLVGNGTRVAAGDVLIRLDDMSMRSEAAVLEGELLELVARRNRLEAEHGGARDIAWDPALALASPGITSGQQRLFAARRAASAAMKAQLRERISQTRNQVSGLQAQLVAVKAQREFIARELAVQRGLFDKGLTRLHELLGLEREAARLNGQAGDVAARIAGARSRIAEIESQILLADARRVSDAEQEAREVQARENEVAERLSGLRQRLGRMHVRAPVSGEVFDMRVFVEQEVLNPGEPILTIAPDEARLVVRARLDPIHVDAVWPGQEAVLLFPAFSTRTTPTFRGRVSRVSANAVRDVRTGESHYALELELGPAMPSRDGAVVRDVAADAWAKVRGWLPDAFGGPAPLLPGAENPPKPPMLSRHLALVPGMPVEIHVRTSARSPLSYFTKPLADTMTRAMREE